MALIKDKKKAHYTDIRTKLGNAKSAKDFWETLNRYKSKQTSSANTIPMEVWLNYFNEQNKPNEATRNPDTELHPKKDEFLDKEITLEELQATISKIKENKAAGPQALSRRLLQKLKPRMATIPQRTIQQNPKRRINT